MARARELARRTARAAWSSPIFPRGGGSQRQRHALPAASTTPLRSRQSYLQASLLRDHPRPAPCAAVSKTADHTPPATDSPRVRLPIGVIAFELLSRGVASSTLIDASSSSLDVARTEAERRGVRHRMTIRHGDAVEETDALPAADLVTLDRVVCCYPYAERLLAASTSKAGAWYALSYPRNRWFVRLGVRVQNGWRTLQGHPFRTFVHDPTLIDTLIRRAGFARHSQRQTIAWQMVLYRRA